MAIKTARSFTSSFFLFLLLSSKLVSANKDQALFTSSSNSFTSKNGVQPKVSTTDGSWKLVERSNGAARRMMIGSIAPHCTYNECRGCRFKCSAEQVPVDANDPMNSAYRYRCVCHR